jgi:post-segregation antitoxin (ccd killing protein)
VADRDQVGAGGGLLARVAAATQSCVYNMRMARVNVYLPDELAARARDAGLNVSGVTQEALEEALALKDTDRWLHRLEHLPRAPIAHHRVIEALDDARDELGA